MELGDGLGIKAATTWLPDTAETAGDAVAQGRVSETELTDSGIAALPVSHDLAAPEMAVLAARRALDISGVPAAQVGLGVHAWIHHQGHDFFSPAHYVLQALGATAADGLGVEAMCNGGGAGLELGASRLLADPRTDVVLLTTADRFHEDAFDRWAGDFGVFYGDGATAMLIGRRDDTRDVLTLLSVSTATVSSGEALHRGQDAFSTVPRHHSARVDARRTKRACLQQAGGEGFQRDFRAAIRRATTTALRDAGVATDDPRLRCITVPRVWTKTRREVYYEVLDGLTGARILDLGEKTGHLGAGDLTANCADVIAELEPGELALSYCSGGGFGFTCAVLGRPEGGAG